ncbi:hypothetical protein AJ80_08545 [Polytolypa hystricis UAMH7299]|uniref:BSD domain-containing protein n=1 Tax=Polytolypa hystricis (strain UAMH7299) TaxID=1447883 RepID=A0A2B7X6F1_POLH7|nr:hypothetical protein AJ80_08545 [Polytolypa hystricis UAMH7299]
MPDEQVPLLERAEMPEPEPLIPKEAARDISLLEHEFIKAEVDLLRHAIPVMRPLYTRRNELIASKLQNVDFWPRVLANGPAEVDNYILPSDAEILGRCLRNITIDRFEVNEQGEGEPRTIRFNFEFDTSEENVWFENEKIVKELSWRKIVSKSVSGKRRVWEGLVSDPVRIKWKAGMDPTKGLLDAACDLADAEKAALKKSGKAKLTGQERIALPEFEKLVSKVAEMEAERENEDRDDDENEDGTSPAGLSFFAWFGYRGRDITAEESLAATKDDNEHWEKYAKGEVPDEESDDEEEDDEDDDALEDAEIFPDGEELTIAFGEDVWPNALKYYVQSYEIASDFGDDFDLADLEDLEGDSEEEDESSRPRKKVKT